MKKEILSITLFIVGLLFLIIGIYIGETDDSPGAGGLGIILMIIFSFISVKTYKSKD